MAEIIVNPMPTAQEETPAVPTPTEQKADNTAPVVATPVGTVEPTKIEPDKAKVDTITATKVIDSGSTSDKADPLKDVVSDAEQESIDGYTPKFSNQTRTVMYVVCLIMGLIGGAFSIVSAATASPQWLTLSTAVIAYIAPLLANAFGVAYNPVKLASK